MFFLFDSASNVARVTGHDFDIFRFIPGYSQHIVGDGKEPVLLLLLAFLITFALTRLYTRLARVYGWGSGSVGGVHLHHMVVGILIMIATALVAVAEWPNGVGRDLIAIFFGIGAALILDEFALSLYLEDVYWSPEGRTSVDATIMGVMLAGLLMVGISPFGVGDAHYSRDLCLRRGRPERRPGRDHASEGKADARAGQHLHPGHRPGRSDPARQAAVGMGAMVLPQEPEEARAGATAVRGQSRLARALQRVVHERGRGRAEPALAW